MNCRHIDHRHFERTLRHWVLFPLPRLVEGRLIQQNHAAFQESWLVVWIWHALDREFIPARDIDSLPVGPICGPTGGLLDSVQVGRGTQH